MFTQNTPVPLRTRSAHPSNLPRRQRHCVPAGQHLTQTDPLATQRKLLSATLSQSAAPVSCQMLCTLRLTEAEAWSVSVRNQLALSTKNMLKPCPPRLWLLDPVPTRVKIIFLIQIFPVASFWGCVSRKYEFCSSNFVVYSFFCCCAKQPECGLRAAWWCHVSSLYLWLLFCPLVAAVSGWSFFFFLNSPSKVWEKGVTCCQ